MKNAWNIFTSLVNSYKEMLSIYNTVKDGVTKDEISKIINDLRNIWNDFIPDNKPKISEKLTNELISAITGLLNTYAGFKLYIEEWKKVK